MDTQIWYAIFSTLCGGFLGAFDRLGEVIPLNMFVPCFLFIVHSLVMDYHTYL